MKEEKYVLEQKKECCGCGSCYNACPVQAIEMQADEEGFLYPVIDEKKCIHCDRCKKVCPSLHTPKNYPLQKAYGCYANTQSEQLSSSSGGVFSVLARHILSNQGIVCGAAYDQEQTVYHVLIDSEKELQKLKETKYVQSRTEHIFKEIEDVLKKNKQVLFSGMPCQVAGLKSYLGKEYSNLICVDLICHGVPSPEVWKKYLTEIAQGQKVKKVTFRNKSEGIHHITLDYHLEDGTIVKENYSESLYMKGFIQNLYVRPSCFTCKFKGNKRCSDLTIGDFWAAKEYHSDFYDENGVSAVIVHSQKGMEYMNRIRNEMNIIDSAVEHIACWNECLLESTKENKRREEFYSRMLDENIKVILEELTLNYTENVKESRINRVKTKLKVLLKRILKKEN